MLTWNESSNFERTSRLKSSLLRRNISSIDLYKDGKSGNCTLVTTMNSGKEYVRIGNCEVLHNRFEEMESCTRSSSRLCYWKDTWRLALRGETEKNDN